MIIRCVCNIVYVTMMEHSPTINPEHFKNILYLPLWQHYLTVPTGFIHVYNALGQLNIGRVCKIVYVTLMEHFNTISPEHF